MEICLPSTRLSNVKKFPSFPSTKSSRKAPKFASFSCRASSESANFYKVLSLDSRNADADEIKRAYRKLSLKYHPDVCPPSMKDECTKMFILLHVAYKTLSDPLRRNEYNCVMDMSKIENSYMSNWGVDVGRGRCIWEDQVLQLGRRSSLRMAQKDGSWGARLRAKNQPN